MIVRVETHIRASPEACFDAHRDMGLHVRSAEGTGERIVAGRTEGLLELGETVTFEGRHLGIRFRLTSKIVAFDRPRSFVDEMQNGPFRRMRHIHEFQPKNGGTRIVDTMEFESPLGPFGRMADRFFVGRHLAKFVRKRNELLKAELEVKNG